MEKDERKYRLCSIDEFIYRLIADRSKGYFFAEVIGENEKCFELEEKNLILNPMTISEIRLHIKLFKKKIFQGKPIKYLGVYIRGTKKVIFFDQPIV